MTFAQIDSNSAEVTKGPDGSSAAKTIVVHYHELWLKRGNRDFFLHKLREALRRSLEGLTITRISRPADRLLIELADRTQIDEAIQRLSRVSGISHLGVARGIDRRIV